MHNERASIIRSKLANRRLVNIYSFAATLKHVAQTVAHVELSDHIVEVVFTLFDDNGKIRLII